MTALATLTISTLDPTAGLDDLEPLRDLVGDARVVGIGESAHDVREYQQLRFRLTRFLVERMGFTTLALESGFAEGLLVDRWVRDAPGAAGTVDEIAGRGLTYGFGRSPETRRLLSWLRRQHREGRRVRFAGLDLPADLGSLLPALEIVAGHLEVDPAAREIIDQIRTYAEAWARPHTLAAARAYAETPAADRDALTVLLAELSTRVDALRPIHARQAAAPGHADTAVRHDERHADTAVRHDKAHTDTAVRHDKAHTDAVVRHDKAHTDTAVRHDERHADTPVRHDEARGDGVAWHEAAATARHALRLAVLLDQMLRAQLAAAQGSTAHAVVNVRDAAMAETAAHLLRDGQRMVISAANNHLQRIPIDLGDSSVAVLGGHLATGLGDGYLSIAVTCGGGRTPTRRPAPGTERGVQVLTVDLAAPAPGSVEALLGGDRPGITDLRPLRGVPGGPRRYRNLDGYLDVPVADAFDLVAVVPRLQ
ncbi:erythromycin esterase family protein [Actinoplanes teichomyceticus]|uniref:Erythromycin esterase n=1 Tax=Actinoplanes teichomyceticus TaxID=1867 RepID=A0A561VMB9_ACTTI|nr:erythromycin esterase family protein [Actinoplanes teichomyceticus]TWG12733.1 erythromycin esterase [Actinoplanes teichomyceticus]